MNFVPKETRNQIFKIEQTKITSLPKGLKVINQFLLPDSNEILLAGYI